MGSPEFKAPVDILGETSSSGVEVRCGTQEEVWTGDKHLGVSLAAVVKTMGVDVIA